MNWNTLLTLRLAGPGRSLRMVMLLLGIILLLPGPGKAYDIDFNNGLIQRIVGIEFQGAVYDVTFGVPSTLLYFHGVGYVTRQVALPRERQLPADRGFDFFELVTDILNRPFFDCVQNNDCQENGGNAYGIAGSPHWLDFNVFVHGQWYMGAYHYAGFWFPDQALPATWNVNPLDPGFNGPLYPRIAIVQKSDPVPEPSTMLLLAFGLALFYSQIVEKMKIKTFSIC